MKSTVAISSFSLQTTDGPLTKYQHFCRYIRMFTTSNATHNTWIRLEIQ